MQFLLQVPPCDCGAYLDLEYKHCITQFCAYLMCRKPMLTVRLASKLHCLSLYNSLQNGYSEKSPNAQCNLEYNMDL